MEFLVKKVPDAVIWMVGPVDPDLERQLTLEARARGVERSIRICGSQSESQMAAWYEKADAYLMTSRREGWSLALGEALAAGLPCVMYELPYLTLAHDNPAVIGVAQGDAEAAADALATVLLNKEEARHMGESGRAFMERLSEYDYEAFWRDCFDSILASESGEPRPTVSPSNGSEGPDALMWRELLEAYRSHLESIEAERCESLSCRNQLAAKTETIARLETSLNETRAELEHVLESKSFKIGLALTQFPRTVLRRFRS